MLNSKPSKHLIKISQALHQSCGVPLAVFGPDSKRVVTRGRIKTDLKWLCSLLGNPRIPERHQVPDGLILIEPDRKMGIFFQSRGFKLKDDHYNYIVNHWPVLLNYFYNIRALPEPATNYEINIKKELKQWIPFKQCLICTVDEMGNFLTVRGKNTSISPAIETRFKNTVAKIMTKESPSSGLFPAGFSGFRKESYFLSFPSGHNRSRRMVFTRSAPFSPKESRLAMTLQHTSARRHHNRFPEILAFCETMFNALLCQNNPNQLFSIIFSKLEEILPVNLLSLFWPDPEKPDSEWKHVTQGDPASGHALFNTIMEETRARRHESARHGFLDRVFHGESSPQTLHPCMELLPGNVSVSQLYSMTLSIDKKPLGLLFLGLPDKQSSLIIQPHDYQRLADILPRILKASEYDARREMHFLEISDAYTRLLQDSSALRYTNRELEQSLYLNNLTANYMDMILQFFQRTHLVEPGEQYLRTFFRFMRNVTGCPFCGIAVPRDGTILLTYKNEDQDPVQRQFPEIDSGIYHDLLFSPEPRYWTEDQPRDYLLPSGHPNMFNSYFIPFMDAETNEGTLVLANHPGGTIDISIREIALKIVSLFNDKLIASTQQQSDSTEGAP
jgi:hypothetical protein